MCREHGPAVSLTGRAPGMLPPSSSGYVLSGGRSLPWGARRRQRCVRRPPDNRHGHGIGAGRQHAVCRKVAATQAAGGRVSSGSISQAPVKSGKAGVLLL